MKEKDGLFTTVVGSLPLTDSPENMIKGFKDIIDVGIDYPCYPQLKSMITSFLDPLSEIINPLIKEGNHFYLNEDFEIPDQIIGLEYGKFILDFFKEYPDLSKCVLGTKACLTGPFTLASEIILRENAAENIKAMIFNEPRALMVESYVEKLAEIMKRIGSAYNDMGINIISMDEPILSIIVGRKSFFYDDNFIIKMLDKAISGIKELSSIHVCGRISPKLRDLLLSTDVKILDHEFRTSESNFETYKKEHFENTDKFIAMGSVQTKISSIENGNVKDYVEDISFLKNYIKKGIEHFGIENIIIKPDCGFAPLKESFGEKLGYKIAINKLKNMVIALKELR
ncbi:MAG: uroporphyrinogen decarboxylase family protein [Promethearchaeota archaeon]